MSRIGLRQLVFAALVATLTACAGSGASAASTGDAPQRRDRTVITTSDIKELSVSNLLEVVQRLHPEWLTPRNAGSVSAPKSRASTATETAVQVYIDLQHAGSTEVLGQLSPNSAASLKYYSASEAQARFGNGNLYGAIQVISMAKPH